MRGWLGVAEGDAFGSVQVGRVGIIDASGDGAAVHRRNDG